MEDEEVIYPKKKSLRSKRDPEPLEEELEALETDPELLEDDLEEEPEELPEFDPYDDEA